MERHEFARELLTERRLGLSSTSSFRKPTTKPFRDEGRGHSHDFRRQVSSESPAADHSFAEPRCQRFGVAKSKHSEFPMKDHYNAVRKSDLYEYGGISKPLLMLIAGLIIGQPEEGEEADPDAGWCVATQDTLAAMVGCSPDEVSRQVAKFERDGWLTVKRFRHERGYPRCHYAITPEQLKKIQARAMLKDEDGNYIRAKMPSKARKKKSHKNLNHGTKKPADRLSGSLPTDSQQAIPQLVSKPVDRLSASVVVIHSSMPEIKTKVVTEKQENVLSLRSKEERMENQKQPHHHAADTNKQLEGSAAAQLRAAGYTDETLSEIGNLGGYCAALNGSDNPVAALKTMLSRGTKTAKRIKAIQAARKVSYSEGIVGLSEIDAID